MSQYFSGKTGARPHLVVGKRGVPGEVDDLRNDVNEALAASEANGFLRVDTFVDPPVADPDAIMLEFVAPLADTLYRANRSELTGAVGAGPITGGPRSITVTRTAATGGYVLNSEIIIKGFAYEEPVTLTFVMVDADGSDVLESEEDLGLDTIESVFVPAQALATADFSIGFGADLVLFRSLLDLGGISTPLREVNAGSVVTNGTFTDRKYAPDTTVPDGARDYSIVYVADPAG